MPHAYPFLLLDRVVEVKKGESLVAVKNITANEWCFAEENSSLQQSIPSSARDLVFQNQGAIFPEVLLIEAAAQAALVLYEVSKVKPGDRKPIYKFGQAKAEFIKSVSIGDQLQIKTTATKMFERLGYMDNSMYVDNDKIADIRILYSVER